MCNQNGYWAPICIAKSTLFTQPLVNLASDWGITDYQFIAVLHCTCTCVYQLLHTQWGGSEVVIKENKRNKQEKEDDSKFLVVHGDHVLVKRGVEPPAPPPPPPAPWIHKTSALSMRGEGEGEGE